MVAAPPIESGTTFRVLSSGSGSVYSCTFLYRADPKAGIVVRLADRRLARLDPTRLDWSSFERLGRESIVRPGDDITLSLAGSQMRGALLEPIGSDVAVRTPSGREERLPLESVREVLLSFRANELEIGDRFVVRSRSGNYYRGRVLEVRSEGTIPVVLEGGARVSLNWARLDPNSLVVLVPLTLADAKRAVA